MKIIVFSIVSLFLTSTSLTAQLDFGLIQEDINTNYMDCAAIFYNGKMLVDKYSPEGKCSLSNDMKGTITVSTVSLDENGGTAIKPIRFRVAIKNSRTNTIYMYNNMDYLELKLGQVMMKCEKDDKIIIMTTDQRYSLTHHEIDVKIVGC